MLPNGELKCNASQSGANLGQANLGLANPRRAIITERNYLEPNR